MLSKPDTSGVTQGALVVIFGMILGSLLTLVFQRYGDMVEAKTAAYYMRLRSVMGAANITLDDAT